MRILISFAVFPLFLLIANGTIAEESGKSVSAEEEATTTGMASGAMGGAPTLHGELALSLSEAIAMGIENNLNVELARFTPLISDLDHTSAWGAYDPNFFASYEMGKTETPVASELQAGALTSEYEWMGGGGVSGLIPKLGGSYEISYLGRRLKSDSSIQSLSPENRATLLGTLTVPVLKGAWWGEPWIAVKQTGLGTVIADEEFRTALMDITQGIGDAYWNVAAADERRRVAQKSLEARRGLLEQTQAQYEVGVVSRVEVTEAEAGVAEGELGVIVTENEYRTAQDRLIDLVLGPHLTPDSRLEIRPTDSPEEIVTYAVDPVEANRKALTHRPELEQARTAVEQQEIELKFRKNQRLPQVDLKFTYGYQGLSGQTNDAPGLFGPRQKIPIARSYWATDDNFFSADGARQWSGGAVVTIPIGNVSGRAGASKEQLALRRAHTQLKRLELDIMLEVRKAIRDLDSSLEGIDAAERRRLAAAEQLRAENIRLEHGESTPFDVLQREEVLVDAESQKINALQLYKDSVTALDRAQGTILRNNNIVVEEAAVLR
jgi:outer membrane protein TolC